MTPYYQDDLVQLFHGDCIETMRQLPDASVDAVVTDPPYGIRFMGQAWDGADIVARRDRGQETSPMPAGVGGPNGGYRSLAAEAGRYDLSANAVFGEWCASWAAECLRVLKPGGHLIAFGGSRTWHRLTAGVEDAGFEIRDSIAWLYGSGFPKSLNLDGDWAGWGTALKPSFDPIVVARKPLAGTVAANAVQYGTGALHIDACRIGDEVRYAAYTSLAPASGNRLGAAGTQEARRGTQGAPKRYEGRWPTNVVLDDAAAVALDQQSGTLSSGSWDGHRNASKFGALYGDFAGRAEAPRQGDSGGAGRFFPTFRWQAKAPSSERPNVAGVQHPTVKPLALMRWLVRLVAPRGAVVLEPFAGSGTTVEACVIEGMRCIAIEREAAYLPLITSRLAKPIEQTLDLGGAA
jgi:site-specific DNA-methyltransferase (adenine-specific)